MISVRFDFVLDGQDRVRETVLFPLATSSLIVRLKNMHLVTD
jgi:hypothetical protein